MRIIFIGILPLTYLTLNKNNQTQFPHENDVTILALRNAFHRNLNCHFFVAFRTARFLVM